MRCDSTKLPRMDGHKWHSFIDSISYVYIPWGELHSYNGVSRDSGSLYCSYIQPVQSVSDSV